MLSSIKIRLTIFNVVLGVMTVLSAPVDVNNDDRPIVGVISPQESKPIVGREQTAILESEAIPSKTLSLYDGAQKKYADILNQNAKPIVDTIQEHEKYGNDGDRFGAGRAIVNGYEGFANLVNKLIDAPKAITRTISQRINDQLNIIGAKIVGL